MKDENSNVALIFIDKKLNIYVTTKKPLLKRAALAFELKEN